MKTIEERKLILEREIVANQQLGWSVRSQSDTYCQMYKTKGANGCLGIFLLLCFIVPGILYFIFYKSEKLLSLSVDEYGNVISR